MCVICGNVFAQNKTVDSLKLALMNANHDTTRVLTYLVLGEEIYPQHPDSAVVFWHLANALAQNNLIKLSHASACYLVFSKVLASSFSNIGFHYNSKGNFPNALECFDKCLKILEEIGDKEGMAYSLNDIALIYKKQGDIHKALGCFSRSLKIREEIGDNVGIARSLNDIGGVFANRGDIPKALEYHNKSIKISERIGDKNGLAVSLLNNGTIYHNQGDFPKALEYYGKSLKISEEIGDNNGVSILLNNIGLVYHNQGDFPTALEYYGKSLKIKEASGDINGIATSFNNIGNLYDNYGDPSVTSSKKDAGNSRALEYYGKSLKIYEEIGDIQGFANTLNNIARIYFKQKNYIKALESSTKSMKVCRQLGFPENIRNAAQGLNAIYKATGNYRLALENYELYIQMRDSINNESTRKASIKSQLKYEYEKQAAADSVAHAKENEIKNVLFQKQTAEIKAKKNQQYALFGGLGLVIIFAGFMYNRFKITQKQKIIIEHQKEIVEEQKKLVEEKQKEVIDSIRYAKRIQTALLPNEKYIQKSLAKLTNHEGK